MVEMITPPRTSSSALRYRLAPDAAARSALDATFAAYQSLIAIVGDVVARHNVGANLVLLHTHAYERIRKETALPARLVTLGLRDYARYRTASRPRLPLDDKLARIKGPAVISVATVRGRFDIPFDYAGYSQDWEHSGPALLVATGDGFEIHYGVTPSRPPQEHKAMDSAAPDNLLSRVGRLIASIAYDAIEHAEGHNKLAVVNQAIREIERAETAAREALAAGRAEQYRLNARRTEIEKQMADLTPMIRSAVDGGRDDLAKAGIARQLDLEAQFDVLTSAIDENTDRIEQHVTSLRAVLSALQDAEQRRDEMAKRQATAPGATSAALGKDGSLSPTAAALRAGRAVARASDSPAPIPFTSDIDELSTLHRDREIAARLAQLKSGCEKKSDERTD